MTDRPRAAMLPIITAAFFILGAASVLLVGAGGRLAAPSLASEDCFADYGPTNPPEVRVICLGDTDAGGWCAGLSDDADKADAALICAWPALLAQEVSTRLMVGTSAAIGGLFALLGLLALVGASSARAPADPN